MARRRKRNTKPRPVLVVDEQNRPVLPAREPGRREPPQQNQARRLARPHKQAPWVDDDPLLDEATGFDDPLLDLLDAQGGGPPLAGSLQSPRRHPDGAGKRDGIYAPGRHDPPSPPRRRDPRRGSTAGARQSSRAGRGPAPRGGGGIRFLGTLLGLHAVPNGSTRSGTLDLVDGEFAPRRWRGWAWWVLVGVVVVGGLIGVGAIVTPAYHGKIVPLYSRGGEVVSATSLLDAYQSRLTQIAKLAVTENDDLGAEEQLQGEAEAIAHSAAAKEDGVDGQAFKAVASEGSSIALVASDYQVMARSGTAPLTLQQDLAAMSRSEQAAERAVVAASQQAGGA